MERRAWESEEGDAEEYREFVRAEYDRLRADEEERKGGSDLDFQELRLRLFLSLLDRPQPSVRPPRGDKPQHPHGVCGSGPSPIL